MTEDDRRAGHFFAGMVLATGIGLLLLSGIDGVASEIRKTREVLQSYRADTDSALIREK